MEWPVKCSYSVVGPSSSGLKKKKKKKKGKKKANHQGIGQPI